MSGCDQWSLLKAFEILLCFLCLIFKWWTDYEASRLFFLFEKLSREWPLSTNVTWNETGSWFADVTFGAYTIICIALFIANTIGELKTTRKTESFLLGIGALLFVAVGMLVLSSFDNVPDELIDNAVILGLLSLITGFVFLIDAGCLRNKQRSIKVPNKYETPHKTIKREVVVTNDNIESNAVPANKPSKDKSVTKENGYVKEKVIDELRSSLKKKTNKEKVPAEVEKEILQKASMQYGRQYLENRGFSKSEIPEVQNNRTGDEFDYEKEPVRKYSGNQKSRENDSESGTEDEEEISHREVKHLNQIIETDHAGDVEYIEHQQEHKLTKQNLNRKHQIAQTSESFGLRDSSTSTNDGEDTVDYAIIQSSKVTSSYRNRSGDQSPAEELELHAPITSSVMPEKNRKLVSTVSPSKIGRLPSPTATNCPTTCNGKTFGTIPETPRDPGYVLHTASHWPNPTPLCQETNNYVKKVNNVHQNNGKIIHSEV